jgi:SAM-dependent methyltransferase
MSSQGQASQSPSSINDQIERAYDEVTYNAGISTYTHPYTLATNSSLCGLKPPIITTARILEIGCALGNNLIPIAESLPESVCIGIDLSSQQIKLAREASASLQLKNIVFIEGDIIPLSKEIGPFDYVICHGVYSWVPEEVRAQLFSACARLLSPHGILYMSYNTTPGWNDFSLIRELHPLICQGAPWEESHKAKMDQWINIMAEGALKERYKNLWFNQFRDLPDFYLQHGLFAEHNYPLSFTEVVADARKAHLFYCIDSNPKRDLPMNNEAFTRLAIGLSHQNKIQLIDYFNNRSFRCSLFSLQKPTRESDAFKITSLKRLSLCSLVFPLTDGPVDHHGDEGEDDPSSIPYQHIFRELPQPLVLSSRLGHHVFEELNRARPYALSLESLLKKIKGTWTLGEVISSLMVMYINQYIKISIDGYGERAPALTSAQDEDFSPTHHLFRPRLNPINLSFVVEGRIGLLYNRWHEYSTRLANNQYTPLTDLFDGTRTLSQLVETLPEHPRFNELGLNERSGEQHMEGLLEVTEILYQAGFLQEG